MALIPNLVSGGSKKSKVVPDLYTRKGSNTNTKKSSSTANRQAVKKAVTNNATNKVVNSTGAKVNTTPKVASKKTAVNKNSTAGVVSAGAAKKVVPTTKTVAATKPIVNTSGNKATSGGSSGGGSIVSTTPATPTNNFQSLIDYFKQKNEAARQSAINAIMERVNAQKGIYNDQMNELGGQYQALRNQSEVERYKTRNALREAQANRGQLDSGYGRQEQLLMDTQYGNAINSINMQEQSAMNEIKNLIAQAVAEGEADKTEVNNQSALAIQQYIEELQKGSK